MKTPRFWKLLEELGLRTASRKYYQGRLGDEYAVIEHFIAPAKAADGVELHVAGYPCYRCRRSHTVEPIGHGEYVAYADVDTDRTPCADIKGLSADDVWPLCVNVEGLARAVAAGLAAAPEFTAKGDGLWRIGMTERRRPVFLSLHGSDVEYEADADTLRAATRGQFLLLTATARNCVADRLGRDGGGCFSLGDVVAVTGRDVTAVTTAESLIVHGLPGPAPAGRGPALSMRGRRYVIEDGFVAITRLKPRKRHPISTLNCREALRVLVDGGHGSEARAIHKRELCLAVWRARHAERPELGDAKPIQFFRVRRAGRTVTVPWYRDVIGTDDHGLYWLNL